MNNKESEKEELEDLGIFQDDDEETDEYDEKEAWRDVGYFKSFFLNLYDFMKKQEIRDRLQQIYDIEYLLFPCVFIVINAVVLFFGFSQRKIISVISSSNIIYLTII